MTSAYFPLSASVIGERIWKVLEQASPEYGPIMHGFTYSGHPVGGAIGLANLQIMEEEGLVDNAARVGRLSAGAAAGARSASIPMSATCAARG